jgi:pheromone shutdown-related protein TraB
MSHRIMSDLASGSVTRLEYEGRELYLIGTAHVSQKSVDEVGRVIRELKPDTVCIELDQTRYEVLVDPKRWRKLDIFQVIRERRLLFLLTSLALSSYQRRLGEKLGVRPGAEMLAAVEQARAVGAEVVLADRDIQATLKRTWSALSLWDKLQLIGVLVVSVFAKGEISAEQVEALKDRDAISEMIREFAEVMPRLQRPLIDERDRYLISSIREAPGRSIVGVVGAGHVDGMVRYLSTPVDRDALSQIPPPTLVSKVVKWIIPVIVFGAFFAGYHQHEVQGLKQMVFAWVLPTSILAGLFSVLAGAKLLTVVATSMASPLTTLNPTIGAGMVAGFVEAWLRRPTVEDCEGLSSVASLSDWYNNRFARVLLVAFGATIGASLGAYVGAAWLLKLL